MVRTGFNAAKHNERLLQRYLGDTTAETLKTFRRSVDLRIAPTEDFAVNSKTLVKGLSLEAQDAEFRSGSGPSVDGTLLGPTNPAAWRRR